MQPLTDRCMGFVFSGSDCLVCWDFSSLKQFTVVTSLCSNIPLVPLLVLSLFKLVEVESQKQTTKIGTPVVSVSAHLTSCWVGLYFKRFLRTNKIMFHLWSCMPKSGSERPTSKWGKQKELEMFDNNDAEYTRSPHLCLVGVLVHCKPPAFSRPRWLVWLIWASRQEKVQFISLLIQLLCENCDVSCGDNSAQSKNM